MENVGKRSSVATVELYIHERFAPASTPVKQLRDFERMALALGQTKTVRFTLTPKDLMLDRILYWVVAQRTFDVIIGKSSADILLTGALEVEGSGRMMDIELGCPGAVPRHGRGILVAAR